MCCVLSWPSLLLCSGIKVKTNLIMRNKLQHVDNVLKKAWNAIFTFLHLMFNRRLFCWLRSSPVIYGNQTGLTWSEAIVVHHKWTIYSIKCGSNKNCSGVGIWKSMSLSSLSSANEIWFVSKVLRLRLKMCLCAPLSPPISFPPVYFISPPQLAPPVSVFHI